MAKAKNENLLTLDIGKGNEREFSDSDENPVDNATGESLFDDLSPRFVRKIEQAAEKEAAKTRGNDEDEDLEPTDEEEELDDSDAAEEEDEPEAELEADEVDEDADEPRPGHKPSRFEKRIARATRIAEEARAENAELHRRLNEREQQDRVSAETTAFETLKADTERQLKKLRADKINAAENGDTTAGADIDEKIIDLRAELRARTVEHERAKKTLEEAAKHKPVSSITLTKVAQWKRKNPRYTADADFAATAIDLDRKLIAAGSNPESDAHYKALDKQLQRVYPELAKRNKTPVRRHPSAQITREGTPGQRRESAPVKITSKGGRTSIQISPAKLAAIKLSMPKFGMDPTNKQDILDYISNNQGQI